MQTAVRVPATESIRDGLEPVPLPDAWMSPGFVIVFGLGLLMALALAIRRIRQPRNDGYGSPAGRAKTRLSMINPEQMSSPELFRDLRAILADYLSARAGVAALKQTSPEILTALRTSGFGDLPELQIFLKESDRARFSAEATASTPGRDAIEQCRAIVEQIDDLMKRKRSNAAI